MNRYNIIFDNYKEFIEINSKYKPRVVKYNTNTSAYFPIISCLLADNPLLDKTSKNADKLEKYYFTIEIYAKDTTKGKAKISSQVIIDELIDLTYTFFESGLNMDRKLSKPTINIDTSVLRHIIQYECTINNRGNIIRR